jgi:hypothetical protein
MLYTDNKTKWTATDTDLGDRPQAAIQHHKRKQNEKKNYSQRMNIN